MQAIKTVLWVIVAIAITAFAAANWQIVTVRVSPNRVADVALPALILVSFGLGFLPPYLANLINRWRLRRQINQHQQTIAQLRATPSPAPVAETPTPSAVDPLP